MITRVNIPASEILHKDDSSNHISYVAIQENGVSPEGEPVGIATLSHFRPRITWECYKEESCPAIYTFREGEKDKTWIYDFEKARKAKNQEQRLKGIVQAIENPTPIKEPYKNDPLYPQVVQVIETRIKENEIPIITADYETSNP